MGTFKRLQTRVHLKKNEKSPKRKIKERIRKARPCIVGEWSPWSGCTDQCQPAARVRRRRVRQEPRNGGAPCPPLEERAGCLDYSTPQGQHCGHSFVPAFITTSAFNKERTRQAASPQWSTVTEDAGYCMEFKTESLTHHCAMENHPLTRWMQYLREGYTVCVDCQPPAMNSVSLRCSGDGLDSDGNQTLHWQAIGNPRCQGTWKKVRRVDQCSCPAVHSFIFI
ncbi:somatomedin-B and thrombospondin type-1 domain-containing protein [Neomonachus schauinslandi]|uniref:Somatomedin-B and thrombospondin type-1 domain-containing protein n=1 Tax=Neomonachus schauinslandi TaxID=29088 RepID=A0A8M1MCL1_NEOSC|nr:somatomedin-B and thrombospondin type-1 domain-containing protein [Neomonachus schauinslandi]